jgi:Family of unknown function (DUF6325)
MSRDITGRFSNEEVCMAIQQESSTPGATVLGPIDLLVVEFPGNRFTGAGLRELHTLVAAGTIRIIDLVLVTKDQAGQVSALELNDLGPDASGALVALRATVSQMLTTDDIDTVGEQLANNTAAAIMLYENTWAIKTKQAIMDANGRLVLHARIPHDIVQGTLDDLAALGAPLP